MAVNPAQAINDSLKTVAEFGYAVFNNVDVVDTVNGSARLPSGRVNQLVRDAVVEIGTMLPPEKAKSIVTTSGTFGYLIDTHLDSVRAVFIKRNKFAVSLYVVSMIKFREATRQQGPVNDTATSLYCGVHGDSIYLYPIPPRTDTIYIFYTARGTVPMANDSIVRLPHELYPAVEYLATIKAAADIGNQVKLKTYGELYAMAVNKFRGKMPQ